jgi:mono/diheme cytochrome c family protein
LLAIVWMAWLLAVQVAVAEDAGAAADVQFNRDIRPILSDNCFQCHGPDHAQRKAELRLDIESSAKRDMEGVRPIVPGRLDQSRMYQRITSVAADERMPPPASGKKLSPAQIERIARWIEAGAKWEKHWAFIPPGRPVPPTVRASDWVRNPIDAFILSRLEIAGLAPSPEADKTTLIRRATLDLTGLPPTPAEVDAFLADGAPDAYERVVDRLLSSPRYGERMATRWLDAARYADTSGYQTDGVRSMWRWRDWVIEAFNRNQPFDQFTIEQIAGDLLPGATLDQRIATGFNRNHRGNAEGGIIPEEYAVEYVVDRVDTTATVWLGLTMACARCHDHKFDPITHKEFYQFFAFFNNVPEKGRAIKVGNSPPMIKAPTRRQQAQLAALDQRLATAEGEFARLQGELAASEVQWAAAFVSTSPIDWNVSDGLVAHLALDHAPSDHRAGPPSQPTGTVSFSPGVIGLAAAFDGASVVEVGDVGNFGYFDKFSISAWIFPESADGTVLARMSDAADADGYSVQLVGGKLQVNLVKRWLDDAARVETEAALALGRWQHVAVTYDGSRVAGGIRVFVDGQPQKMHVLLDELNQTFNSTEPLRIGGGGPGLKFKGLIDDVRIYKADVAADDVSLLATPETIEDIVAQKPQERTARQAAKLRAYFVARQAPDAIRSARERVVELRKAKLEFEESFPSTMVMEELPVPRDTFMLERGQYDKPGERVTPGLPASLNPPASGRDRLALARWLVDPGNPLTARVAVNRFWQSFFGTGLVKTVDDFGAQGDAPSHAELLDWLASEFVAGGWNTKALHRAIITSASYRQSSKVTARLVELDPDNRLLARGPRFRLPAEVIRDQSLAAGGLLAEEIGGESVHPYQPPGLWKELTGGGDVVQDHGASLYRRSLYTFWKRTIAPPSMILFDAAGREACSVREMRTNTPLQALALLNEVTFVEAARMLAQRVMIEEPGPPEARITLAFRLALARRPTDGELKVLVGDFERQRVRFREHPAEADKLLRFGEAPVEVRLDAGELAAYTAVASLILNLDEMVTKE